MPGDTVAIAFTADVGALQTGASQASAVVASTTKEMGAAAEQSSRGFGKLTDILKEHRRHVSAESGLAKVLAHDLAGLGLEATGAGGAISHMISSLAIGGGIGAALAAVKLISEEFKLQAERAQKLGEVNAAVAEATAAGWARIRVAIEGTTVAQKAYDEESGKHSETVKGAKKELDEYSNSFKGLAYWFNVNDSYAEGLRARIEALNKAMAAQRNQADIMAALAQEQAKGAQSGAADKVIAQDEEKKRKAARASALADAKMHDADVKARIERDLQEEQDFSEGMAKIYEARAKKEKEIEDAMRTAEIEAANRAFEQQYEKEQRDLEARQKSFEEFAQKIGSAIGSAFEKGGSPAKAISAILKDITKQILQSAIKQITASAAVTAGEGAKSQAGIPVVGPSLAIGAMAVLEGAVLGLIGHISSAAGGWYEVPSTQLMIGHEGEQMLPAKYASGLRRLIESGGGGANVTMNISTMDARSFEGMLRQHDNVLFRVLDERTRDGR